MATRLRNIASLSQHYYDINSYVRANQTNLTHTFLLPAFFLALAGAFLPLARAVLEVAALGAGVFCFRREEGGGPSNGSVAFFRGVLKTSGAAALAAGFESSTSPWANRDADRVVIRFPLSVIVLPSFFADSVRFQFCR